MFCPRRTGSYSIARSWSSLQTPVLHTHNLYHFVVFDKKSSRFLDFVRVHFSVLDFLELSNDTVQYSLVVQDESLKELLFNFFDSLQFVTSVRDPLARQISQFLQSVTIEQINAVIDRVYPDRKRLKLQLPNVAELCHFRQKMSLGSSCPIVQDALDMILSGIHLLTIDEIYLLFENHFINAEISEFTEFFLIMQVYVTPDFDFTKICEDGYDHQEYSFCGVGARHLLVKFENFSSELKKFTGISELGRERCSEHSHHLFSYPVQDVQKLLYSHFLDHFKVKMDSTESQIVSGLGY